MPARASSSLQTSRRSKRLCPKRFDRLSDFSISPAGEAMGLTWAGVDFNAGVVRLEPGVTKNREGREFPINALPQLVELLKQQHAVTAELGRKKGRIITAVFHRNGRPVRSYARAW